MVERRAGARRRAGDALARRRTDLGLLRGEAYERARARVAPGKVPRSTAMKHPIACGLALATSLAAASPAWAGPEWLARPVYTSRVSIEPLRVNINSSRLWVRTRVTNHGSVPLLVDRDAVTAVLPNGNAVTRASGVFTRHQAYVIPPGASRNVYVDFREAGFRWEALPGARVDFSRAVRTFDGPVSVPPMQVGSGATQIGGGP